MEKCNAVMQSERPLNTARLLSLVRKVVRRNFENDKQNDGKISMNLNTFYDAQKNAIDKKRRSIKSTSTAVVDTLSTCN